MKIKIPENESEIPEYNKHIRLFAFRAIDNPELSKEYFQGQNAILKYFNVPQVSSAESSWMKDPNVYCVIAQDAQTKSYIGGAKLHKSNSDNLLPMQLAIGKKDKKLLQDISINDAEICGLWISKRYFKFCELSGYLLRSGIALSKTINVDKLYAFAAPHTLELAKEIGFNQDKRFKNEGNFYYPSPKYLSTIVKIEPNNIPNEFAEKIAHIKKLSGADNVQINEFRGQKVKIEINLDISHADFTTSQEVLKHHTLSKASMLYKTLHSVNGANLPQVVD